MRGIEDIGVGHQEDRILLLDAGGPVGDEHVTTATDRRDAGARRQRQLGELAADRLRAGSGPELLHLDLTVGEVLDRKGGRIAQGLGDRPRGEELRADQSIDSQ